MHNTITLENNETTDTVSEKSGDSIFAGYFGAAKIGMFGMLRRPEQKKRTRLIAKMGTAKSFLLLDTIALFYSKNKIVFAVDHSGKKFIVEENLTSLENELDAGVFFRANRQYIININHIKSFKGYEKVKLKIEMKPDVLSEYYCIIISQEKASLFKKWVYTS